MSTDNVAFPIPDGCRDSVKSRLQLVRNVHSQGECYVTLDQRTTALLIAPPQAVPFQYDSVHEAISRIHYDQESPLFSEQKRTLKQLLVGVNVAFFMISHDSMKVNPHPVLDGWLAKVFKHIVLESKRQYMHHNVTLRCQMVACLGRPPAGHSALPPAMAGLGGKCYDLLRDPNDNNEAASEYAPFSTFDMVFHNAKSIAIYTPEDGVNAYVLGTHNLKHKVATDHSQNTDHRLEDATTIFCLECRQEPKSEDDVLLYSKLFVVDMPSYSGVGLGEGLTKFFMSAEVAKECQHNGRATVNTLPADKTDTVTEIIAGEGLLGGNCMSEVVLFFEERAGLDQASTARLLQHTSALASLLSSPLLNDAPTLLYTTRQQNALVTLRHICTQGGRAIPIQEHETSNHRYEIEGERMRAKLLLLSERLRALELELIDCERQKQMLYLQVEELKEKVGLSKSAQEHQSSEVNQHLGTIARELEKVKAEATQADAANEKIVNERDALRDEFVNLRANYLTASNEAKQLRELKASLAEETAFLKKTVITQQADHVRDVKRLLGGDPDAHTTLLLAADTLAEHCVNMVAPETEKNDENPATVEVEARHLKAVVALQKTIDDLNAVQATHHATLKTREDELSALRGHLEAEQFLTPDQQIELQIASKRQWEEITRLQLLISRYESDATMLTHTLSNLQSRALNMQDSHIHDLKAALKAPPTVGTTALLNAIEGLTRLVCDFLSMRLDGQTTKPRISDAGTAELAALQRDVANVLAKTVLPEHQNQGLILSQAVLSSTHTGAPPIALCVAEIQRFVASCKVGHEDDRSLVDSAFQNFLSKCEEAGLGQDPSSPSKPVPEEEEEDGPQQEWRRAVQNCIDVAANHMEAHPFFSKAPPAFGGKEGGAGTYAYTQIFDTSRARGGTVELMRNKKAAALQALLKRYAVFVLERSPERHIRRGGLRVISELQGLVRTLDDKDKSDHEINTLRGLADASEAAISQALQDASHQTSLLLQQRALGITTLLSEGGDITSDVILAVEDLTSRMLCGDDAEVVHLKKNKLQSALMDLPKGCISPAGKETACNAIEAMVGFRYRETGEVDLGDPEASVMAELEVRLQHIGQIRGMEAELVAMRNAGMEQPNLASENEVLQQQINTLKAESLSANGDQTLLRRELQTIKERELRQQAAHIKQLREAARHPELCGDTMSVAVDTLVEMAVEVRGANGKTDIVQIQAHHSKQILALEEDLQKERRSSMAGLVRGRSGNALTGGGGGGGGGAGGGGAVQQGSFKTFLEGTHRTTLRELEEYKSRALRAEAELQDLETSTLSKLEILQREKLQLQSDLARARGET